MLEFVELSLAEYRKFVKKAPGNNFFQSEEMYRRYRDNPSKFEAYLLGVKDGQEVVLVALVTRMSTRKIPILGENKLFAALRGPVMDYDRKDAKEILQVFFRGAKTFLRAHGGAVLRISPNVCLRPRDNDGQVKPADEFQKNHEYLLTWFKDMGLKNLGEYGLGKWLYAIDIKGKTPDEIFKDFRKGLRYNIKWAENRYHVVIKEIHPEKSKAELETFNDILRETESRQGFHEQRSEDWQKDMMKYFGEQMKCYLAEITLPKKVPIAVGMFAMYGDEATYLLAGTRREYQKYGGASLIIWTAIKEACQRKMSMVNLYGAKPERGNKLFEFKRGFHGHALELAGTFALPLNVYGKIYTSSKKYTEYLL
ncbi:peptidoglycan bridge formation glycyltransferase FemA/FemB family protein [Candidatus Saccharibacteria bacterium]|nr:peptidoglycan bridge formation glycyltransferase FemA/FemB family protein [Candidatus Saccharibacteria bacterium]